MQLTRVAVVAAIFVAKVATAVAWSQIGGSAAQSQPGQPDAKPAAAAQDAQTPARKPLDQAELERKLKDSLTGVTLTGTWRMHSGEKPADKATLSEARPEKYDIVSADKEKDDLWIIRARIRFGENDVALPVRVRIVWADDTPIITVDEVNFPGIGVYTARVMIYRGYYCGTWFGKDYGGVMSGEIIKTPPDAAQPADDGAKAEKP